MGDRRWLITSGAFVSMSFIGMSRTFLGTALPAIRFSLELTILQAGTLTALLQLGFSTFVFVGGPISDIFKKSSILMLGCLFMGTNLLLFGYSEWFWLNLIGIVFVGIGGGLIESSSNPLLIQLFPGRESMVMQLHHFFFAGLAMGRLFSSYLVTRFHEATYLLSAFSLLFLTLLFSIYASGKWTIPFFALSGLAQSGVFPSLLGMTGKIYSKIPGTAMGILATGAGFGSVIIPWLMSLIAQLTDLRAGFLSFEVFVVLCIALMGIQFHHLRQLIPLRVSAR